MCTRNDKYTKASPICIWTCLMNWKFFYLKKSQYLLLYVYWRKRVGKSSNTFVQFLIYWKIQVSRNNLYACNVRFLTWLFILSFIAISRVITATMLFTVLLLYSNTSGIAFNVDHISSYTFTVHIPTQDHIPSQFLPGIIN